MSKGKTIYFFDSKRKGFDINKEKAIAKEMGAVTRDSSAFRLGDYLEDCESVAGCAPQAYLDKYPLFELPEKPAPVSDKHGSVPWLKSEIERLGGEFGANESKPRLKEILKDLTEG